MVSKLSPHENLAVQEGRWDQAEFFNSIGTKLPKLEVNSWPFQ
jgi:hypothetical protein